MKHLLLLAVLFLIPCFIMADGVTDQELADYFDSAFPNQYTDGLIVVGSFNHPYFEGSSNSFIGMLKWLACDLSDETLAGLSDSALGMFEKMYEGSTPNNNWSVVIDANAGKIVQVFHAQDIAYSTTAADGTKVYTGLTDTNQSGGQWQYSTMTGNSLGFSVPATNELGEPILDAEGKPTSVMEYYKVAAAVNWSPILIDMDFDGKSDTNRNVWLPHAPQFFSERTAKFDMSGDGLPELAEWIGANDGLLVLPEPDGTVRGAMNLFGNAGGYSDGYEKMSVVLDLDGNGWVEKEELNGLYIWRDLNTNAKVDKDEMKTVQELGIEKISVSHKNFQSVCFIKGKEVSLGKGNVCYKKLLFLSF